METPLTPAELARFEQRLRAELARADEGIENVLRETLEPSGGERFQESDESEDDTAFETELGVLETEDELACEIRDALERLARATYGVCEDCQQPIARLRLEAAPYARLCAPCAGAVPAARSAPEPKKPDPCAPG